MSFYVCVGIEWLDLTFRVSVRYIILDQVISQYFGAPLVFVAFKVVIISPKLQVYRHPIALIKTKIA